MKGLLPKSPRKTKAVIRKLATEFKVSMNFPKKGNKGRLSRIPEGTVVKVKDFFNRDQVSRMCPGKRDVVTVRVEGKKEKHQKRHMCMSLK